MIINSKHMLSMRSKRNGFNSFVKHILLDIIGLDHTTLEEPRKWPKEMLGKEMPDKTYKMLVKNRNVHLDDIQKYKELEQARQALQKSQPDYWNNK